MEKEELEELYLNQKLSSGKIAELTGTYKKAIQRLLHHYNIPIRTAGESRSLYLKNNPDKNPLVTLNTERSKNKKPIIKSVKPQILDHLDADISEWTIENYKTKKKNMSKRIYSNGFRIEGTVEFTCSVCGKRKQLLSYYFIEQQGEKICRGCKSQRTKRANGWKMPESAKKTLSEQRKGIEKNTDYFDFTCPVCNKTFSYRNILRNRKKIYCSKECQKIIWVRAPRYNGEMNNLEKYFASILDEMEIFYLPQYQIGLYFADFFLPEYNLVILVDGDYWHVNLNVHPEGATGEAQKINIANDKRFEGYLKSQTDYKLFRIWEEQINSLSKEELKEIIKKALLS